MRDHELHHLILKVDLTADAGPRVSRMFDTARGKWLPGELSVLDRLNHFTRPLSPDALGLDPEGLVVLEDGRIAIAFMGTGAIGIIDPKDESKPMEVDHPLPYAAAAIADLGSGIIAVSDPIAGGIAIGTVGGDWEWKEVRGTPPDRGEIAFYAATHHGASCHSCHAWGGTDHSLHNIGMRVCRTRDLRGIGKSAPYFRRMDKVGGYANLEELYEEVIDHHFGGLRSGEDASALAPDLARYVSTLPREPVIESQGKLTEEGYAAFKKASCHTCHPAPAFTNFSQHPAAWLFPEWTRDRTMLLDVPSLLGIGQQPQLLEDGRAGSVREVFSDHNVIDRHGHTAKLEPEEMEALMLFLEAL